jgi:hypothetical protein
MSFNVKITYKNVPTFTMEEFKNVIKETSESWALMVVNKIKLDISGNKLKVKSGKLRNSIDEEVKQSANKTTIKIGSWNIVYAEIHDKKTITIIRPKQKKFLTIPVNDSVKGRALQYSNAYFMKFGGNLFLVQAKKGWINPLFLLRKEVKIKGTGYITDNVNNMKPNLELMLMFATERDIKAKIK